MRSLRIFISIVKVFKTCADHGNDTDVLGDKWEAILEISDNLWAKGFEKWVYNALSTDMLCWKNPRLRITIAHGF